MQQKHTFLYLITSKCDKLLTEQEIIDGCKRANGVAQRELYERYGAIMFGVCCRYVSDRATAEDLLHDGFITVFTKIGEFRGEGSFEGWCRRIFVNTALGYLRRKNPLGESDNIEDVPKLYDQQDDAVDRMSGEELVAMVSELHDGYRTILNLYAVEGYSHKEIGDTLGITENTSRSQYFRARGRLMVLISHAENRRMHQYVPSHRKI